MPPKSRQRRQAARPAQGKTATSKASDLSTGAPANARLRILQNTSPSQLPSSPDPGSTPGRLNLRSRVVQRQPPKPRIKSTRAAKPAPAQGKRNKTRGRSYKPAPTPPKAPEVVPQSESPEQQDYRLPRLPTASVRSRSADSYLDKPFGYNRLQGTIIGRDSPPQLYYATASAALGLEVDESDLMSPTRTPVSISGANTEDRGSTASKKDKSITVRSLSMRNVAAAPEGEGAHLALKEQIKGDGHGYFPANAEEKRWRLDREKCEAAHEALFQHTIMIEAIDRHFMLPQLDYACESVWSYAPQLPIVQGAVQGSLLVLPMSQPQPDLIVAFKKSEFLKLNEEKHLGLFSQYMTPEKERGPRPQRAFPFLIVEVKGAAANHAEDNATMQAIHGASRALYNIWKFYENGPLEQEFFQDIKVFSAVGFAGMWKIMIHWATEDTQDKARRDRLFFWHDNVQKYEGDAFSKAKVLGSIKNIMKFGVDTLSPKLKKVVKAKCEELKKASQPPPQPAEPESDATPRATPVEPSLTSRSSSGDSDHQQVQHGSGSKRPAPAQQTRVDSQRRKMNGPATNSEASGTQGTGLSFEAGRMNMGGTRASGRNAAPGAQE